MALDSADKFGGRDLEQFTDCMFFINGHCKHGNKCKYRHCPEAAAKTGSCFKWPQTCRNIKCPYRHPKLLKHVEKSSQLSSSVPSHALPTQRPQLSSKASSHALPTQPTSGTEIEVSTIPYPQEGFIGYFWDIENVPIPGKQKPFDIVQSIRNKFGSGTALKEDSFSCFCDCAKISSDNQLSLRHANVRIVHIPAKAKSGAADREILLELDRFERAHSTPATVVLISGDIDFVQKLNDLRYRAGFYVIVIHNKPAKEELKQTVSAHYPWESFLQLQQSVNETKSSTKLMDMTVAPQPLTNNVVNQNYNNTIQSSIPSRKHLSSHPKARANIERQDSFQYPKCTNKFESTNALQRHQDDKDHLFYCSLCGEKFRTQDGLNQHQRAKDHYVAKHKCDQCNRHFTQLDSLKQHQKDTNHITCIGSTSNDPLLEIKMKPMN